MDHSADVQPHARARAPTIVVRLGLLAVGVLMGILIVQGLADRRIGLILVSTVCLAAATIGLWLSFRRPRVP